MRHFFRKKTPHDINLHVYEKDNPDIKLNILFRDYLLSSPKARTEYNILKQELIEIEESHKKNKSIFTGYNLGKDKFIRKILDKSRYNGLNFRFCTHHIEWKAYHNIAYNFFNSQGIKYNPNHSNFSNSNYYHFILNKGSKIICIAELKWIKNSNPTIKYLTIDKPYEMQNLKLYFENLIAKWINSKK